MSDAVVLQDTPSRRVIRIGDTVRRPTGWWTPAVHGLLRHLEANGFPYSPRVIGIDGDGREILTYIPGDSGPQGWAQVVGEAGLIRFAHLLRAYHDAVSTYRPPTDTLWACTDAPLGTGEVICHNDFGPWNVVWRGGHPVGLLDWDFAGPAPAIDDVAYALEYSIPFRDDATALRWLGWDCPPDRPRRMALFADAYGLSSAAGLVDQVIRRQRLDIPRVAALAAQGLEPQVTWVATGMLAELEARAAWTEDHRALFE